MPNEYKAAVRFYDDYYRPNNCVLVMAGDVEPQHVFTMAEKLYGAWKSKPIPKIPDPAPLGGPKRQDLTWSVDVPPRVQVGYRMPPYKTSAVETAVGRLLPELLASETAPLYQKMRYQKQTATALFTAAELYQSFGPGPMVLTAILYKEQYDAQGAPLLEDALGDMVAALNDLKSFSQQPDAARTLDELKDKYTYDLLSGIDSPAHAAELFAEFYRFERDTAVFDSMIAAVRALKPEDIDAFARATFVPANQVTVTLVPDAAQAAVTGTR
jgi:zinc protease